MIWVIIILTIPNNDEKLVICEGPYNFLLRIIGIYNLQLYPENGVIL